MYITIRSRSADNCERQEDDDHEEDNLDQRGSIFKPSKDRVGHGEDSTSNHQENSDCFAVNDGATFSSGSMLTGSSFREITASPELDQDIEESSFRCNNRGPSLAMLVAWHRQQKMTDQATQQNQHRMPMLDQPICPHSRYNFPKSGKRWSFRTASAGLPKRMSRPVYTQ